MNSEGLSEIDSVDAKLIKRLLKDSRASFKEIAKQSQTSESIIRKRYKKLEDTGVIVGSTIQLDYSRMGYVIVGNIFFRVEPQLVDQAIASVQIMPNVHAVWRTARTSGINVIVIMEKLETLEDIKERIRKIQTISELRTYIWTRVRNIRENLTILPTHRLSSKDTFAEKTATLRSSDLKMTVDETDRKIIEKLSSNSRTSFRTIAKQLSISTDTVARRYKKLKRTGTIRALIQIDPTKLGYNGYATFYIAFGSQSLLISDIENICLIPDVVLIVQTSGSFDLWVEAMIRDLGQLLSIQDQLTNMLGVVRCETHINTPTHVFPTPREYISTF